MRTLLCICAFLLAGCADTQAPTPSTGAVQQRVTDATNAVNAYGQSTAAAQGNVSKARTLSERIDAKDSVIESNQ
jgi:hypothetical protein